MNYNIERTSEALTSNDLYEGRVVCFSDVETNPNNVGILHRAKGGAGGDIAWESVINGVKHQFNNNGCLIQFPTIPALYGVVNKIEVEPTIGNSKTRTSTTTGKSNTVSLTTMTPKDYFACHALNALLRAVDNPLSLDDAIITLIAVKSYKIAQAMATEAYNSRENDNATSSESGTEYAHVDVGTLTNDTDRLLYNINESIKANTENIKTSGVKISNIDKVKFDGTQTIQISGTPNVNVANTPNVSVSNTPSVNVSGTPDVYVTNMPYVPTEPVSVTGTVNVTGTVSVDNFPETPSESNNSNTSGE